MNRQTEAMKWVVCHLIIQLEGGVVEVNFIPIKSICLRSSAVNSDIDSHKFITRTDMINTFGQFELTSILLLQST